MVNRHSTRKRNAASKRGPSRLPKGVVKEEKKADLVDLVDRLGEARSFLECGIRLVDLLREARVPPTDESVCLRHGLKLLTTTHNELDLAVLRIQGTRHKFVSKEADPC